MEEELNEIPISWISEYSYCKRRFYLRYVEGMNIRSADMVEGRYEHRVVDERHITRRGPHITASRLYVSSEQYKIYGFCDNVEFDENLENGAFVDFLQGKYAIKPVEFKHGKRRQEKEFEQQLCGQVFCLEETYGIPIHHGVIYYVDSRERMDIEISDNLRQSTAVIITSIRHSLNQLYSGKRVDHIFPVQYQRRCEKCALFDICSPKKFAVDTYMKKLWDMGCKNDSSG